MAGTRTLTSEPPRSTAYYYADLERLKRKSPEESDYTSPNEVVNDIPGREVPPFRDRDQSERPPIRDRQWSLPEYNTPENSRKGETYSTAGTFPMPEPKEKEPLLAELEVVGRLPLTQLDGSSVRRSRSWYLCCPNVGEEEISRDSSWRYSSLRPVTVPPIPGQNGLSLVATQSSNRTDDLSSLRAERDALARALAAERQRAASAARAHDARLAELHGVIAELVRRRAQDKHAGAIPEEELSVTDECESTTQPAGELDNDGDRSRTDQNDSSSLLSPCELPTPQDKVDPLPDDTTDTSGHDLEIRLEHPRLEVSAPMMGDHDCEASLNLSEKDSEVCLNTRCCGGAADAGASSCEREHGSAEHRVYSAPEPGRCETRQAKIASRVKLKKTEDSQCNHIPNDEAWCASAERLALDVCAQADLREALVAANNDGVSLSATLNACKLRCSRLQADAAVLQCALTRAADTAHRLYCACMVQESVSVGVCLALRAADRALETYDVLLALAETEARRGTPEREAAELIAGQLLARLDAAPSAISVGSPLLSVGPWQWDLANGTNACTEKAAWDSESDARLRAHAARLKADTVALRPSAAPHLFSYHDIEEEEIPKSVGAFSMAGMEAAVMMQEVLAAKEARAAAHAASLRAHAHREPHARLAHAQREAGSEPRPARHWLQPRASETDL